MASDKLQRYALVTEIVGGLAVLLSLIILIIEVRENTEESRRTNLIQLTTAPLVPYLQYPEIRRISSEISEPYENSGLPSVFEEEFNISREDSQLYARYLGYSWRIRESEYLYGNSEPEVFEASMLFALRSREDQLYWEHVPAVFQPEFVAYIQNLLKSL